MVISTRNEIDESIRLTLAFEPPFSLDLIVRTPKKLRRDVEDGRWFSPGNRHQRESPLWSRDQRRNRVRKAEADLAEWMRLAATKAAVTDRCAKKVTLADAKTIVQEDGVPEDFALATALSFPRSAW